jgi:hypothetical protein
VAWVQGRATLLEERYKTIRSGISRRIWRLVFRLTDRRSSIQYRPVLFARVRRRCWQEDSPVEGGADEVC